MKKLFLIYGFLFISNTYAVDFQLFTVDEQSNQKTLSAENNNIGTYISTSNELKNVQIGDTLIGLSEYKIVINARDISNNGDVTLFGQIKDTNYRAIITRGANGTFARIHTESGVYSIEMTVNGEKLFTPEHYKQFAPSLPDEGGVIPLETLENYQKKSQLNLIKKQLNISLTQSLTVQQNTDPSDTSITIIDIMVFWDLDFQNFRADPLTALNHLISLVNSDFLASAIYIRLNLVYGALKGSFVGDYQPNGIVLAALRNDDASYGFSDVSALREQHKADLVGYLRHTNSYVSQGVCGTAYKLGANGVMPNSDRVSAFFVVSQGSDLGTDINCGDTTFSHEIGHNLGSTHDRANDNGKPTIFPYSYGYGNAETDGIFGTIMSYAQKKTYLFSNPNIDCDLRSSATDGIPPSIPCGKTGYADNATGFNAVRNAVAGFDTDTSNQIPNTNLNNNETSSCFIATAAYGSYLSSEVKILRDFRDDYLLTSDIGKYVVEDIYYKYSPSIANYIASNENLRTITRWGLTPIIYGIKYPLLTMLVLLLFLFIQRKKIRVRGIE